MAMSPQESRRRVLVVEDERPIRELLRLHLSPGGFDVIEGGDGKKALDRTRTDAFQLILLGLVLPGLDGGTLCRPVWCGGAHHATPLPVPASPDPEAGT